MPNIFEHVWIEHYFSVKRNWELALIHLNLNIEYINYKMDLIVVYPIGSRQLTVIMTFASSRPIRIDLFIDWLYEVLVLLYLLSIRVTS